MFSHLSVLATHDFTPILLTRYIQYLLSTDNEPLVSKLVSVVLVASQQLYKVSRFRKDVRIGLQTALMNIFQNYPDNLMDLASELLEFVDNIPVSASLTTSSFSYVLLRFLTSPQSYSTLHYTYTYLV